MRCLALVSAIAACALLSLADPPARAAQGSDVAVTVQFEISGSKGFSAEVDATNGAYAVLEKGAMGQLVMVVNGEMGYVLYGVEAEVSRTGVHAEFGRLGYIDLDFHRSKRYPDLRCKGKSDEDGYFVGAIRFRGERGYTTIRTNRVKGEVSIDPRHCGGRSARASRAGKAQDRYAFLVAGDREDRSFMANGENEQGERRGTFYGSLGEESEGVKILRTTVVETRRPGAFAFDHDAGVATVRPPGPFSGQAHFVRQRGSKRRGSWRGNLAVKLLGHDPVRLAGREFEAVLMRKSTTVSDR